jgi:hypothetical protein
MSQRTQSSLRTKMLVAPQELRARLESARLDLRALYRSLDRLVLAQDLPAELGRLQELDADYAEALWVLDQPRGAFDLSAMTKDTVESLARLPSARKDFLALFDGPTREILEQRVQATRERLSPTDAYLEVAGRDPSVR